MKTGLGRAGRPKLRSNGYLLLFQRDGLASFLRNAFEGAECGEYIPIGTAPGTYSLNNDFALLGGLADTDHDPLGNAAFTVVVPESSQVPEPSTWVLLVADLRVLAKRRCRGLLRVQ
jgi:hypothetical protein